VFKKELGIITRTVRFQLALLCIISSGREVSICTWYWELLGSWLFSAIRAQFPCTLQFYYENYDISAQSRTRSFAVLFTTRNSPTIRGLYSNLFKFSEKNHILYACMWGSM